MTLETIQDDAESEERILQARIKDSDAYINVELPRAYHEAISVLEQHRDPFQATYDQVEVPEDHKESVSRGMRCDGDEVAIHVTVPYKGEENREDALLELREIKHALNYFESIPRKVKNSTKKRP